MEQREFKLVSKYKPAGSQPEAIEKLVKGLKDGQSFQVLLGVTGSGKTFTMANVITNAQRPALIIAHNKTLAAQLCNEFRQFFPHNRVEYFVSYYDYYQPEAYIPSTDTFIEKDMSINDEIDKLRHSATSSLLERSDVIVVASVSCIYGLGAPKEYFEQSISLRIGNKLSRTELIKKLVAIQYKRAENDFIRSTFRSKGEVVDIFPAYSSNTAIRVTFFGNQIEEILEIEPLTGGITGKLSHAAIFPASHYVVGSDKLETAIKQIRSDLAERLKELEKEDKLLEAHRLKQRVNYDLEMITEMGFCSGIENYSRYFDGRNPGEAPFTLLDYFPKDFLLFIDESHITLPQVRGMFNGDKARKQALVDYGFRLPSAYDNRPLNFAEFNERIGQTVYVSATPAPYELGLTQGEVVEQIIRPTGLLDPKVEIRPQTTQVQDLLSEIKKVAAEKGKTLVTTLTKKMAEDLTAYYTSLKIRVRYLHSEIDTLERIDIINALRADEFDVLVGINLLREGLDIPEVMLVAILDADKEGFLRSETSLIQTIGRAARNAKARVLMYANNITGSMQRAIDETNRRRIIQDEYNKEHGIIPQTIISDVKNSLAIRSKDIYNENYAKLSKAEISSQIERLKALMDVAAKGLDFEAAIKFREEIARLKTLKRK